MRSVAEARLPWERAARAIAVALVVLVLLRLLLAHGDAAAPAAHLTVAGDVNVRTRDSLAARARAGDAVTWSGDIAAVATSSEPVRDPSARTRISVVSDGAVALGDSLGDLDSLPAGGGSISASGLVGAVRVRDGLTGASAAPNAPPSAAASAGTAAGASEPARTSTAPGRVFVLGRVGWEAKFTIAALEEDGWEVDARLRLSDSLRVAQGASRMPVSGTHAVVVALDTALGADAAQLMRFVRAGGGLVLSGEAAAAPAFAALAPARAPARSAARLAGEPDAFDAGEPLHALPLLPLTSLRADAVVLERRDAMVAVAARRVAAGRIVQSGVEESWRWRMQGGASGAREHREWWTHLVSAAAGSAPSGAAASAARVADASAPRAALVQQLGDAVPSAPIIPSDSRPLPAWLGAVTLILLVAEWASRRARGAA